MAYSSKTNYANERKYLSGLISTGGGKSNWAKQQLGALEKWNGNNTNTSTTKPVVAQNKPLVGQIKPLNTSGYNGSTNEFQQMKTNYNFAQNDWKQENGQMYKAKLDATGKKIGYELKTDKGYLDKYAPKWINGKDTGYGNNPYNNKQWGWNADKNVSHYGQDTSRIDDSKFNLWQSQNDNNANLQVERQKELDMLKGFTPDQLKAYREQNKGSQIAQNLASLYDGTFEKSGWNYAPIDLGDSDISQALAYMAYKGMGQDKGIGKYEGLNSLEANKGFNLSGLKGLGDINLVNEPFLQEQMLKANDKKGESSRLEISPKDMLQEAFKNGEIDRFLVNGYTYDPTTNSIKVKDGFIRNGDTIMSKNEAIRYGHDDKLYNDIRRQNEQYTGDMLNEPLEYRAKFAPETLTPEMQQDLEMERSIKSELEKLTLQLEYLDELEGGGMPMVLGGYGNGANGSGSGLGNKMDDNAFGNGVFGQGGNSLFEAIKGRAKGSEYRTVNNNNPFIKQAFLNRM